MPRQKNFKRIVRTRMAKTGESYTAARARLAPPGPAAPPLPADPDSAALARALAAAGYPDLTEHLLFGVAGGIGFGYLVFVYTGWTSVNLDGRFNALYFERKNSIETASARLGIPLRVRPTSDPAAAERYLREALATVPEVAVVVDLTRISASAPGPYRPHPVTVAADRGGRLTVTGLPRGRVTMDWPELIAARWTHAKKYGGLYRFGPPAGPLDLAEAVRAAIGRTADCLLAPDRSRFDGSFGIPGIRRWAALLTDPRDRKGWPKLFAEPDALHDAMASVARGLRDPARRRYAAFLDEAAALLDAPALAGVAETYRGLGDRWTELTTRTRTPAELAGPLPDLADAEEAAALSLRAAVAGRG